jgi:hypothetical protein
MWRTADVKRPVHHLRHYLAHHWRFQRQIVHHHTGQVAYIHGTASWQEISESDAVPALLYREAGVIQLANYTGNATQTYSYVFPNDAVAEVYFSDGHFFYTLDLTTSHCEIQHPCGEDMYHGVFDAISETTYRQIWRVTGPCKDYTSDTTFSRS